MAGTPVKYGPTRGVNPRTLPMFKNSLKSISSIVLVILISALVAFAQQGRGALRGLVVDELGAAIVGASVTLTDAKGQEKTTVTNAEGLYTFSGLTAGKYSLRASAKGFANSADTVVEIKAGDRKSVDLTVKVTIEE